MTTYRYATTDDLLRAIELVPVWTASLFKRWDDATTPRNAEPARFFYHWESKVGVSHVGNVVAPWGRNTYRR